LPRFIVFLVTSTGAAMPHGPRRFAKNSENVRHFRLVARSQHDEAGENADASPLVLEPFVPSKLLGKVDEAEMMTIPESLKSLGADVFGTGEVFDPLKGGAREEYSDEEDDGEDEDANELDDECYFPKDGYDYNKHLKTLSKNKKTGGVGGIAIEAPPSAEALTKTLYEKDPERTMVIQELQQPADNEEDEVMQALLDCDNPGYEDFEDDFFEELGPAGVVQPELMMWGPAALDDVGLPDLALFKEMHAQRLAAMGHGDGDEEYDDDGEDNEGAGERGEAPSAAHFDEVLEDEYADEETGALDDDEIEGPVTLEEMEAMLDEYLEDRAEEKKQLDSINEPIAGKYDNVPRTIVETRALIERYGFDNINEDEADADTSEGDSEEDESKNWDCETVLSTLSNLSNRPGKIEKLKKLIKKTSPDKELPAIAEGGDAAAESSDEDGVELPDVVTDRPKNESAEDKKLRKNGVKEMRRICRKMKKESKDMYKAEEQKLNKKVNSGDVRSKLRVQKL